MSIVPAIFLFVGLCFPLDAVIEARIVRIYSTAAVLAQEAFSNIRTVHAFWSQEKVTAKYDECLGAAHVEGYAFHLAYRYILGAITLNAISGEL